MVGQEATKDGTYKILICKEVNEDKKSIIDTKEGLEILEQSRRK